MKQFFIILAATTLFNVNSFSDWSYPGCSAVTMDDFQLVPLATLFTNDRSAMEPLKLSFDMDELGIVTVYWVERKGTVKRYNTSGQGGVEVVAEITTKSGGEDGLVGIELDPDFRNNSWIYLFYTTEPAWVISRFTLKGDSLDMNSEKRILEIPSVRNQWHTGGGMSFDDYGNLWIAVGDNEQCETGPANTADLRGGILRIRPLPFPDTQTPAQGPGGTYTIPEGNYWEFGANFFENDGKPDIAAEYRDAEKVKRELYAKGMRNPYGLGIEPVRQWASYGDCGPDHEAKANTEVSRMTEEHSTVVEPGFFGWPYWSGSSNVTPELVGNYSATHSSEKYWGKNLNMDSPVNANPSINGVENLTPHIPGTNVYSHQCAVGAFFGRYNPRSGAAYKLPPHFDHYWFAADFNTKVVWAIELSEDGRKAEAKQEIWNANSLGNQYGKMLDIQQGPDGAVYIVGYSCSDWRTANACTGIWRIEYTGPPCNTAPGYKEEIAGCMCPLDPNFNNTATHHDPGDCQTPTCAVSIGEFTIADKIGGNSNFINYDNFIVSVSTAEQHRVRVFNIKGKELYTFSGKGQAGYHIPKVNRGIHIIELYAGEQNKVLSKKVFVD